MELSPEDIRKDKNKQIPADFKLYIYFDDFCSVCKPEETEIEDLCDACKKEMGPAMLQEWIDVRNIIYQHDNPGRKQAEKMLAGVDPKLEEDTLKRKL